MIKEFENGYQGQEWEAFKELASTKKITRNQASTTFVAAKVTKAPLKTLHREALNSSDDTTSKHVTKSRLLDLEKILIYRNLLIWQEQLYAHSLEIDSNVNATNMVHSLRVQSKC